MWTDSIATVRLFFLFLSLVAVGPLLQASHLEKKTIYGEDSRREIVDLSLAHLKVWRERTVAFVDAQDIDEEKAGGRGRLKPLGPEYKLCPGERFYNQPTLSFCTGFFLDSQWIATARHCIEDIPCEKIRLLRDYTIQRAGDLYFSSDQILKCKTIVSSLRHDLAFVRVETKQKFSFMPLSLPITTGLSSVGSFPESVEMLGFPLGLPMKWAQGQLIHQAKDAFLAQIDSFEGNSGSPIVDPSARLVGLLVSGDEDFEAMGKISCQTSYQCVNENDCEGEEILPAKVILREFSRLIGSAVDAGQFR